MSWSVAWSIASSWIEVKPRRHGHKAAILPLTTGSERRAK